MRRDEYIAAVCAEFAATGEAVDGCNDPRSHTSGDWFDARRLAESVVNDGLFTSPDYDPSVDEDYEVSGNIRLVPTAKAWFEVFR